MLMDAARTSCAALDPFSVWLLAAFGAVFGLLVANIDAVRGYLYWEMLQLAFYFFISGAISAVVAKLLAAQVGSSVIASSTQTLDYSGLDMDVVWREFLAGTLYPYRWLLKIAIKRLNNDDLTFWARITSRLAQLHLFLVVFQAIFFIGAAVCLVAALNF